MRRDDEELGPVRRCSRCGEEWPDDPEFYLPKPNGWCCRACLADYYAERREKRRAVA